MSYKHHTIVVIISTL